MRKLVCFPIGHIIQESSAEKPLDHITISYPDEGIVEEGGRAPVDRMRMVQVLYFKILHFIGQH